MALGTSVGARPDSSRSEAGMPPQRAAWLGATVGPTSIDDYRFFASVALGCGLGRAGSNELVLRRMWFRGQQ